MQKKLLMLLTPCQCCGFEPSRIPICFDASSRIVSGSYMHVKNTIQKCTIKKKRFHFALTVFSEKQDLDPKSFLP